MGNVARATFYRARVHGTVAAHFGVPFIREFHSLGDDDRELQSLAFLA
jgi:hypothetical protein